MLSKKSRQLSSEGRINVKKALLDAEPDNFIDASSTLSRDDIYRAIRVLSMFDNREITYEITYD